MNLSTRHPSPVTRRTATATSLLLQPPRCFSSRRPAPVPTSGSPLPRAPRTPTTEGAPRRQLLDACAEDERGGVAVAIADRDAQPHVLG
jgi:hypothetical protein